jgi:O-antigen/teichoic acid export membrane protein
MSEHGQSFLLRRMLRGFSVSVLMRVSRLFVSLFLTSVLARYQGQVGFGQLMVSISIVGVLLCIVELGLAGITTRELVKQEDAQWGILGTTFFTRLLVGTLLYAGLIVYVILVSPNHGPLLLIYGCLLVTHAGTEILTWLVARHQLQAAAWSQLAAFLISALFIAAGVFWKAPLWYFACTYVLECWLALAFAVMSFHRHGGTFKGWQWSSSRAVGLLGESWYELVSQLALLLLLRLDTIMVEALRGPEDAGIYGAAVRVSEVVYFLPVILASSVLPSLIGLRMQDPQRYQKRFADYFALSLLLAVPCTLLLVLAAPYVISLLFGSRFAASAPILMVHAWAFIPYALGIARTGYLTAEGRLWVNLPSVLIALVLNVVLNWLWIPQYGGIGSAWATFIAYTAAWVGSSLVIPSARDAVHLMFQGLLQMPSVAVKAAHMRPWRTASEAGEPAPPPASTIPS